MHTTSALRLLAQDAKKEVTMLLFSVLRSEKDQGLKSKNESMVISDVLLLLGSQSFLFD